jgi:hypothetical protein
MPVEMVSRGPSIVSGSCPTCNHPIAVGFFEGQNVHRFFCDWCGQWVTAELKDERLVLSTRDASHIPIRRDEKCPNSKCGTTWELWFNPNGAIAKPHGAIWIATGNLVKCEKCGTLAKVSLN